MNIVPATTELARKYYGNIPPISMRGYFLLNDDGEPIGVAGFMRRSKNVMVVFTEGKEEAYRNKKMVMKFARMMLSIADQNGWTLIAQADENIPTAPQFLTRLGFELTDSGEYVRWPFLG